MHLLRVVEDFIHLVGDALKAFQSSLIVTDNLGTGGWQGAGAGCGVQALTGEGWFLRLFLSLSLCWGPVFPFNSFFVPFSPCFSPAPPMCRVSVRVPTPLGWRQPRYVCIRPPGVCPPTFLFPWVCLLCVCLSLLWPAIPGPPAVISIQREPVSAVSSDITFPMRGRRGMKDWVRHSEDRLFLPKEVLSLSAPGKTVVSEASGSPGRGKGPGTVPPGPGYSHQRLLPADPEDSSSYFVIGAVLYRTLGLILPPPR